jgi:hypothetical protein
MTLGNAYSAKQIEIKCEFIFQALVTKRQITVKKVEVVAAPVLTKYQKAQAKKNKKTRKNDDVE